MLIVVAGHYSRQQSPLDILGLADHDTAKYSSSHSCRRKLNPVLYHRHDHRKLFQFLPVIADRVHCTIASRYTLRYPVRNRRQS
jgi:hypothetical protein